MDLRVTVQHIMKDEGAFAGHLNKCLNNFITDGTLRT
jgi:hypothetical protein